MFKNKFYAVAMVMALPFTASANESLQNFSAGLKVGMFMVDSAAADGYEAASGDQVSLDDGFGFGLHADYKVRDNWYVDVEYTSVSLDMKSVGDVVQSGSIDVTSFAVYGAYRTVGDVYYLGKLGLISEDVSGDGVSESEVGLSFSVGAGFKVQENLTVEAEFTSIEQDIGFIGITGRYQFK